MRNVAGRLWKQAAVVAMLVGVDLAVSLPIMGATYRPFSWMSIAPADAATLYPVMPDPPQFSPESSVTIRNLSLDGDMPVVSVEVTPGPPLTAQSGRQTAVAADRCVVLQRSTNILDADGWTDIAATTSLNRVIHLIDTNPISRAVYYRVRYILGE